MVHDRNGENGFAKPSRRYLKGSILAVEGNRRAQVSKEGFQGKMMNFNNFLFAICIIMAFEVSWNFAGNINDLCPVEFPQGFFCDLICQKWGVLSGSTIMCFISSQGGYQRIIARNPAFGIWRFYKVDLTSHVESLCEKSVTGDEFFLNETEIACPHHHKAKRYYVQNSRSSRYRSDDYVPFSRSDVADNVPMDAVCELATAQICRQGKYINCGHDKNCCYEKIPPSSCNEKNMSQFSECYKVLYNVIENVVHV